MAAPTYSTRALVLKKTKLGESDLILTFLNEDGSLLQAVAKGARKPTCSFASRLELYAEVDLLCSKGRSLDIVKEARLVSSNDGMRFDIAKSTAAAPMAELLVKLAQPGLENGILFDASSAAFKYLNVCNAGLEASVCAAFLLKSLAYCGLRPCFSQCVCCGSDNVQAAGGMMRFSYAEGGCVCPMCHGDVDSLVVSARQIEVSKRLLHARFVELDELSLSLDDALSTLRLSRELICVHVGGKLKSLEFLLTQSFLFESI